MNPVDKITTADVREYMKAKLETFASQVPGFVVVAVDANDHRHNGATVKFRAYNEHAGHSRHYDTPEEAIVEIVQRVGGKTQSELLRKQAEELLRRAEAEEQREGDEG